MVTYGKLGFMVKLLSNPKSESQARRLQARLRTRNSLRQQIILLLLVVVFFISWKLLGLFVLDTPVWSICVDEDISETTSMNGCLPLKWAVMPTVYEHKRVSGKIMDSTKDSRPLAKFLVDPNVNDAQVKVKECESHGNVQWTLVNFIKSSVSNHERRQIIRSTWGSIRVFRGLQIRNIFIVGTNGSTDLLNSEIKVRDDILQVDLKDSARTVPEKVLAGMQWSASNLQQNTLYSSMDDDVVVHIPNLVNYLRQKFLRLPFCHQKTKMQSERPCFEDLPILCVYAYKNKDFPERNWFSKWYTPYSDYPGMTWPTYCRGGMYILPVKMVKDMFEASRFMNRLMMDDVWVTGFMRRKLGKGDSNIVPAPHSVRYDFQFRSKADQFQDILVQHLWGDMSDGEDIASQISKVWDSWKIKYEKEDVCVINSSSSFGNALT